MNHKIIPTGLFVCTILLTGCSQASSDKYDTLDDLLCDTAPNLPLLKTQDAMCYAQQNFGLIAKLQKAERELDPLSWQSYVTKTPEGNWEVIITSKDPTQKNINCNITITPQGEKTTAENKELCHYK